MNEHLEPVLHQAVQDLRPHTGIVRACQLLGRSRATHHRRLNPPEPKKPAPRTPPPSTLTSAERAAILELMNSPAYAELPPAQIWARELDEGRYHCSVSTMYRILREHGQTGERRRTATHPPKTVPELRADGPGQVFTWDITRLKGPGRGEYFHAYVIIDIYSRYVAAHTVERAESGKRAAELIADLAKASSIAPAVLHADRGAAMTSKEVSQLLLDLGIERSHSRPKQSNDNPYSEAQFKTLKYTSDYPDRFASLAHARQWLDGFMAYYNHEHRHSGIGYHTPASVHFGTAAQVRDQRAATLAQAYAARPERFSRPPRPPQVPETVWINDPAHRRDHTPQNV
ncbi:IS3 family transposase [Nocardiopsis sp. HUAS JQ3]|uniref:IS3 family transposase n=1 Tax=Nocardiopsis sp. HUAS JQ3 TaxID=3061629 RepID=UPI0023A9FDF4|nr:IS3 family transposase [Nocardiopsis sp. HUAS JQ3]WDZ93953.1 IS3 family transposase [Nocardiopsis sp. HUAS JQ3]